MSDSAPAVTEGGHLGMDDRHAQVDGDHGPLATQLLAVAPETVLPSLDTGEAVGVVGVVPVAHVVPPSGVAHRPADAADGDGVGSLVDEGPLGDPPVVRLQAEHARESGRDPNGPAPVTTRCDGEEAARHRRRSPSRGPARRALEVPGVTRRSVETRVRDVDAAELTGGRLGGEDRARAPQAAYLCGGVGRHSIGVDERRLGERPTLDRLELFDADGNPSEGKRHIGLRCGAPRRVGVDMAESVE